MTVIFTDAADACLQQIYLYHRDYSLDYAVEFQTTLEQHLKTVLVDHPKIGHPYNRSQGIYRLIYRQRYNVYYAHKNEHTYVLFVFDGQMNVNQQLERGVVDLPDLEES